jgi:hypothetical protein
MTFNYQTLFGPEKDEEKALLIPFEKYIQTTYDGYVTSLQIPLPRTLDKVFTVHFFFNEKNAYPSEQGEIIGLGIVAANRNPGPFRLEIESIDAVNTSGIRKKRYRGVIEDEE